MIENLDFTAHSLRVFDLEFDDSIARFREAFSSGRANPWNTITSFLEAAALAGDRAALREAGEMVLTLPASSWRERTEMWAAVMLALYDDEPDALDRLPALIELFEAGRLRLQLVGLQVAAARALPTGHPDAARFAATAHRLAEEAGAHGLADWVERATA